MRLLFLVALIMIGSVSIVSAQTSWWRTYGGSSSEIGYSVQPTADSGYVIAGYTVSFGAGINDVYLVKTDAAGDTLWTRAYGGLNADLGTSVQQTTDGGYIIAGYTQSFGAGGNDVYLIKTDAHGDTLWTRTYGGTSYDEGFSVQPTNDGGYIVTGWTESFGAGDHDVYLVKTDAAGETVWTRTYGGPLPDEGRSVLPTSDSGYLVAGWTRSFGQGKPSYANVYLVRTNAAGDTLWTRTYGGPFPEQGNSIQPTADSGYIIAGYTFSFGAGSNDVYLLKTDDAGDTLWTRTYGGPGPDLGYSVRQTSDGGYIIVGYTQSFGAESSDVYLIKTDDQGDTLWTRTFGGTDADCGTSAAVTADGGYIIGGYTSSFGAGASDIYLIKTDSGGHVVAVEERPEPQGLNRRPAATVLSGASGVKRIASGAAFDAMGRSVLHPRPGIYFVREEPQASSPKPQAVRKVLLVE